MALTIPNTFSANTTISPTEVNANFTAIATLLNSTLLDSTYIQTGGLATANYADSSVTYAKLAAALQALLVPTGLMAPWGTETAPTGWLKCDGTAVSRTTYSALFAVIGETFGQGDNSTTFNVPDFRGRFLRGMDDGTGRDPDAGDRAAMNTGGLEDDNIGSVQTTATKLPTTSFTTGGQSATHTHQVNGASTISGPPNSGGGTYAQPVSVTSGNASADHTHTVTGGGDNESRPPNANVYWIIKT